MVNIQCIGITELKSGKHTMHSVMYKTIFVINIILHMCLQHANTLCIKNYIFPIFEGRSLLPIRIFSFTNFVFAPKRVCFL